MLAVPLHRSCQPLGQRDLRLPAGQLAQLAGIDPLAVDLPAGNPLSPDLRRKPAAGQLAYELNNVEHPVRLASARVERLPPPLAGLQRAPDRQIGGDGILDVKEVALD